ncbi:undecaprenyl pyrophosphate phosphatase UppP [Nocardia sp. GAS34]|uniref:DUF3054 domain-containing protein n=1 Tax=unclassified Nocardia TaxID=2637762 RepID=UPI003D2427DC
MKRLVPYVIDAVLVIVFCVIGRNSHHEAVISAGLFRTLWPFAVGLLLGWVVALVIHAQGESEHQFTPVLAEFDAGALWPAGVSAWLVTLIGGMVLRVVSGQGVEFSFIVVAASVLGLFLLGWRALWLVIRRRGGVSRKGTARPE